MAKERKTEEEKEENMRAFILIGPPTSGKTSQAIEIEGRFDAVRFRGADILPETGRRKEEKREIISDGEFIPALRLKLKELPKDLSVIVFDNIPRTKEQAEELAAWAQNNKVELHVIKLDLKESDVIKRAKRRIVCPECGESYHPVLRPPNESLTCGNDGYALVSRPGDSDSALRKGYSLYKTQERDLVSFLSNVSTVHRVSAKGTVKETAARIWEEIPQKGS